MHISELIDRELERCECEKRLRIERIDNSDENLYMIPNKRIRISMRVLSDGAMVRCGGGWTPLETYLNKIDPCRKGKKTEAGDMLDDEERDPDVEYHGWVPTPVIETKEDPVRVYLDTYAHKVLSDDLSPINIDWDEFEEIDDSIDDDYDEFATRRSVFRRVVFSLVVAFVFTVLVMGPLYYYDGPIESLIEAMIPVGERIQDAFDWLVNYVALVTQYSLHFADYYYAEFKKTVLYARAHELFVRIQKQLFPEPEPVGFVEIVTSYIKHFLYKLKFW